MLVSSKTNEKTAIFLHKAGQHPVGTPRTVEGVVNPDLGEVREMRALLYPKANVGKHGASCVLEQVLDAGFKARRRRRWLLLRPLVEGGLGVSA